MRIVVANGKGGCGKTTTSVLLAEAAAVKYGVCTLVDLDDPDEDGTAATWLEMAGGEMRAQLADKAPAAGWVVYDTPPARSSLVNVAMESADAVVIPAKPAGMDLARLRHMVDRVLDLGKPPVVLLTFTRGGTTAAKAAREAVDAARLPVLATQIPLREAIQNAYGTPPGAGLLRYYSPVLDELEEALSA